MPDTKTMTKSLSIQWTPSMFRRFKKAFKQTTTNSFIFDNQEYVTAYAKYLIEYLEDRFAQTTKL